MTAKELRDLIISALVLAVAFGIALSGGYRAFQQLSLLILVIGMSLVAVSLSFVFHELAHRLIARRFRYFAEYTMWTKGLLIALGCSFFGFIFAAPGAVMIHPKASGWGTIDLSQRKIGLISLAGPVTNIALAVIFQILDFARPALLFTLGAQINTWLALFNLIPFGPFDGAKVLKWNKVVWIISIAVAGGLFAAQRFLL